MWVGVREICNICRYMGQEDYMHLVFIETIIQLSNKYIMTRLRY